MWWSIPFLILFPMCVGVLLFCIRVQIVRKGIAYVTTPVIMAVVAYTVWQYYHSGASIISLYYNVEMADHVVTAAELVLMAFVVVQCFRYRKYWISLLSILPTALIIHMERHMVPAGAAHIYIDNMAILMIIIVGLVGGLIIIYAMGYMDGYHMVHTDIPERRHYFFMVVYIFIGAMFGFVLSENLIWLDLFWETTSVCSFMLIGYTHQPEAVTNSFRALWMNLLGGCALGAAIVLYQSHANSLSLHGMVASASYGDKIALICVALIAFAALTKAAQLPFSTWLIGAMVAPTPSSALLHSATMVKAGIYVLFRLAPAMSGSIVGYFIAGIGGFTFFMASVMAIGQVDAKKVLAYSTISNLGLMVACAGIGRPETLWAGIFLMLFHAVSKSLLFQDVGAVENSLHSRDIEDMHGLLYRLPKLATFMFIGIAGMFLAPFGMLISKWSALRAAVDSSNILVVLFIVFGSATTSFYWTKWLGKLISRTVHNHKVKDITKRNEMFSLMIHAVLMVLLCLVFPMISRVFVSPLLTQMYGADKAVLPMNLLYTLIVVILVVFAVPVVAFFTGRHIRTDRKLAYMNGINTGGNNMFFDSFGDPKKVWMTNYYFTAKIGRHALMVPCQLGAAAALVIMFCMVIGGVV